MRGSSSGKPYKTPKGHTPAWVERVCSSWPLHENTPLKLQQVEWRKADALNPATYADILPTVNAVVHTIGTLLDSTDYKQKMAAGDVMGFIKSVAGRSNPSGPSAYDTLNYETGA
jgi:hypothetical protein